VLSLVCLVGSAIGNKIGDKGTDPGRCHIYHEGEYGGCNSYQVTHADQWGTCGESSSNPCISTYQPDMSGGDDNCGACWKLTVTYEDGVALCTYIKSIDYDGSEAKFEMSQLAWKNVCPYICDGYGNCAHDAASCPLGVMADDPSFIAVNAPTSCHAESALVAWEMIDCNSGMSGCTASSGGGTPTQPTATPVQPTQPTAAPVQPTQPTAAPVQPTQPTAAPPAPPAPSGGCVAPNGWGWGSSSCVSCSNPVSGQCPEYGYTTCYSDMSSCCAGCLGEGYCNPATCQ